MQTDYIIVGQGICGTMLSYQLVKAGCRVMVTDRIHHNSSSRVASGVITPVTGKRVVKTWMIDELLPVAVDIYRDMERELGINIIRRCDIVDLFAKREERDIFESRVAEEPQYLKMIDEDVLTSMFRFNYGAGQVSPGYLVDITTLLGAWRERLQQSHSLIEDTFIQQDCSIGEEGVRYQDIPAKGIIYCDGVAGYHNPYFSLLPYSHNKGEVIIASIPGLPRDHIYKQGIKIVPWQDDLFWIGSSFEWKYDHVQPTETFRRRVEDHLQYWLKLPYEIKDHWAAERPTTVDYKPFVGMHPVQQRVGVFNGMGTKGCSLSPYFARQFAAHLTGGTTILPDADIQRFSSILSR